MNSERKREIVNMRNNWKNANKLLMCQLINFVQLGQLAMS